MNIRLRKLDTLSKRLRHLRCSHDMSQKELSEYLNVQQSMISKYEKGICEPTLHTISIYSKLFKVSTDYIVKGVITDNDKKIYKG